MPTSPDEVAVHLADQSARADPVLSVQDVAAGYGGPPILSGLSVQVGQGEIVSVVGPNGAGKSTLVKAIIGEVRVSEGSIVLDGKPITNVRADLLARRGIGYVPQVRDVFGALSVIENLEMGAYLLRKRQIGERIEEVLGIFPNLRELAGRKTTANKLSGGERKMLAFGRALMLRPKVLILDEPTAGLAVNIAREVLHNQVPELASRGTAILLIEQRATDALEISAWGYVLVSGGVRISAPAREVLARKDIGEIFLGKPATATG